jgi:predicted kinase
MLAMPSLDDARASVEGLQALADRYLDGRGPLLEGRVAHGRAVDGHGDLLADDIFCLEDGPRVLDCIEFDDGLRLGDGLADAAFLAMDLERLGRPELGLRFLAAYQEHAGDRWPASLAHHLVAYRAQVRAKVTAIRAAQGDPDAAAEARRLLELAATHLEAARVRLVLVGGLPGTGKSTLSAGLGEALTAPVLRSDELRKERAGLDPAAPAPAAFGEGLYAPASTVATYELLLGRAELALAHGETVVLDASWTSAEWRTRARALADSSSADLVEIRCEAPADLAAQRLAKRARRGGDPSDATPEIAVAMASRSEPWPEATTIVTTGDKAQALAAALARVCQPRPLSSTR